MKLKLEIAIMLRRLTDEELIEVEDRLNVALIIRDHLKSGKITKQQLMEIFEIDDERFLKDWLNCYKRVTNKQYKKIMSIVK